jgi:hypothetical protein
VSYSAAWTSDVEDRAVAYVTHHGPSTVTQIADGIGMYRRNIAHVIYGTPLLVIAGQSDRPGKTGPRRNLYGLPDQMLVTTASPKARPSSPKPAATGAQVFVCSALDLQALPVLQCVELYTDATAFFRPVACCQCRTGRIHRARFAGFTANDLSS